MVRSLQPIAVTLSWFSSDIFIFIRRTMRRSDDDIQQNRGQPPAKIPQAAPSTLLTSSIIFIFMASLAAYLHQSQRDQPFKPYIDATSYYSESQPKIYAGEVHYPRIPFEYWDHRIKMIKAMGMNTLSVYTFWNFHEIEKGVFDFENGSRNLSHFLTLAEQNDMKVLIRPGPYVCAEWDLGGYPARLLGVDGLILRSREPQHLAETKIYFEAIAPTILKHLWTPQHPQRCIIMLQIENEYGFYGADTEYMVEIRKMWHDLQIHTAEYYVDWFINIRKGYWPGASIGLNDAFTQVQIDYIHTSLDPTAMVFGGQIYSGWITYWHKEQYEKRDAYDKVKQYIFLMSHNISYSMYMAHGGTNFALTAGANSAYQEKLAFGGQLTSYDYDAPISQQGQATKKYHVFRDAITKYADWTVPEIPEGIPLMTIDAFTPIPVGSLLASIDWSVPTAAASTPLFYESSQLKMYNQGIVVYRTTIPANSNSKYMIRVHDIGFIKIDGVLVKVLDRTLQKHNKVNLKCDKSTSCQLQIITEAMGHINYDVSMQEDQKGLREFYDMGNKKRTFQWKMYTVPIDSSLFSWQHLSADPKNDVVLLKTSLTLDTAPKDTYLNMKQFYKGYVWVNGRNLGRYWRVGPQFRLYCPGVWLKEGDNQIYILDMLYDGPHQIVGDNVPD